MRKEEMETSKEISEEVVKTLKDIKKLYDVILLADTEKREIIVLELLQYFALLSPALGGETVSNDILELFEKYPIGKRPDNSTLLELFLENHKDYYNEFSSEFKQNMFVFCIYNRFINMEFDRILQLVENKADNNMLCSFKKAINNTLVNNPNCKGEYPYYERNYNEFKKSMKLSAELLNKDFDGYIYYFQNNQQVI